MDYACYLERTSYPADEAADDDTMWRRLNDGLFMIALMDGNLIGFVNGVRTHSDEYDLRAIPNRDGKFAHIHSVVVESSLRNQGLGSAMMNEFLKTADSHIQEFHLASKQKNLNFYRSLSFRLIKKSDLAHGRDSWFEMKCLRRDEAFRYNAFSDPSLGMLGNPAVVVETRSASDFDMQRLAKNFDLSETCFVHEISENDFNLRWFTPSKEVELCGHATMCAAAYLFDTKQYLDSTVNFYTKSGLLVVTKLKSGALRMAAPKHRIVGKTRHSLKFLYEKLTCVRIDCVDAGGYKEGIAWIDGQTEMRDWPRTYDLNLISEICTEYELRGMLMVFINKNCDEEYETRYFAPLSGIVEDPATGSAHVSLMSIVDERSLVANQRSKRGARLHCSAFGDKVFVEGRVERVFSSAVLDASWRKERNDNKRRRIS